MTDIIDRLNDPETYVDAIDDAIREIERLRAENEHLRFNKNYGTLTRQALELEHRKLTGDKFVVMIDIDYLHQLNDKYGSQEPVNEMIRNAFDFRDDDLLLKGNYASGDEVAFVVRSDPDGFMVRLQASLMKQGISATMAWEKILDDDLLGACKRAIDRVYELKKMRNIVR